MSEPIGAIKVTVNLIPPAVRALEYCVVVTGDTRTDIINRALQLYAAVVTARTSDGGHITAEEFELIVLAAPDHDDRGTPEGA